VFSNLGCNGEQPAIELSAALRRSITRASQAQARRRSANREDQLARLAWDAEHAHDARDADWYLATVLPGLAGVTLTEIARATGMSTSNAAKVRSGKRVPHPRCGNDCNS
jgi:hypothetical protein